MSLDKRDIPAPSTANASLPDPRDTDCAPRSLMYYDSWLPPSSVAHRVRCCWSLRGPLVDESQPGDEEPALPDGCPELLFNFGAPFEHVDAEGRARLQPDVYLVGPITAPFHVRPTGDVDLIAVRLEPHGAFGFGNDLALLRDQWVDATTLNALDGDHALAALHARLATQDDAARRVTLAAWLTGVDARLPVADARVQALVRAIVADGGSNAVGPQAATIAATPRTLQRLFQRQVGVSPKVLARIVRFHRTCIAWREAPHTLARVAAEHGYADESHLVRDFRRFVGEPPAAFLAALAPFTANFLHGTPKP